MLTIEYLTIGGISVFAVIAACRPFNKLSTFLCTTTAIGYFMATYLFQNLLHLTPLDSDGIAVLVCTLLIAYILVVGLQMIIDNVVKDMKGKNSNA